MSKVIHKFKNKFKLIKEDFKEYLNNKKKKEEDDEQYSAAITTRTCKRLVSNVEER